MHNFWTWIKNCINFILMTDKSHESKHHHHQGRECLEIIEELSEVIIQQESTIGDLTGEIKAQTGIIHEQTRIIAHQTRIIDRLTHQQPPPEQELESTVAIFYKLINKNIVLMPNLSLVTPGGTDTGQLGFLGEDQQPKPEAIFAAITLTGLDGSVATATSDASTVTVTPVAAGSQTLQIDTDVTYQDVKVSGQRTVHKTIRVDITVTAQEVLENTTLTITFGPQNPA